MASFQPGAHIAVLYTDDLTLSYEHIVFAHAESPACLVLTPDRDLQQEDLSLGQDSAFSQMRMIRADRQVTGVPIRDFDRWRTARVR